MSKKKKILLLSDDLRMHSGIATVSKDIVMETLNEYDWVQIAGAIKHPDKGKVFDMSQGLEDFGIKNGYLKVYPTDGYGDGPLLREVMKIEKPDAILHYTDPRFWIWLYNMEAEIRRDIPIFYYNIWDDLPDPMYNELYYISSDLLMSISKQTYGINKRLLSDYEDWQITYVPHGINPKRFSKIEDKGDTKFKEFEQRYGLDKYKYKILYSNRNINNFFISNIDPSNLTEVLKKVKAEESIFIISSKSFGTIETLKNSSICKDWFLSTAKEKKYFKNHFYGITANEKAALSFGINKNNIFPIWDWVGGRYSLWSAVGLPIILSIGFDNFNQLLKGAYEIDYHFQKEPYEKNIPIILACIGILYNNFIYQYHFNYYNFF